MILITNCQKSRAHFFPTRFQACHLHLVLQFFLKTIFIDFFQRIKQERRWYERGWYATKRRISIVIWWSKLTSSVYIKDQFTFGLSDFDLNSGEFGRRVSDRESRTGPDIGYERIIDTWQMNKHIQLIMLSCTLRYNCSSKNLRHFSINTRNNLKITILQDSVDDCSIIPTCLP